MTVHRGDPAALAWLIGNELRQARLVVGETQAAAAKVLNCSPARINYLEIGRTQQRPDDVEALLKFYEVDAANIERLVALAGRPADRTWWTRWAAVIPDWMRLFIGLEGLASELFVYHPLVVPGLLQTRDYMTGLFTAPPNSWPERYQRAIEFRMARQARLADEYRPLRLTTVVPELALDRAIGGPAVLRGQLERLVSDAKRGNVTLRVLPNSVPVHDGLDGTFTILHFQGTQPIVYAETCGDAVYIRDRDAVDGQLGRAGRLQSIALSEKESANLITTRIAALPAS